MLEIIPLVLGMVETNCYLVADPESRQAVVIDPADEGERIRAEAQQRGWVLSGVWITHAHFDHIAATAAVAAGDAAPASPSPVAIALHPADLPLYQAEGGAALFGLHIHPLPAPTQMLQHGDVLHVGKWSFEVRHTPGHTPGHVIFYCAAAETALVGDLIFAQGVGRTDLPGGSFEALLHSIRTQVLTLPPQTRLLPGHGDATTVAREQRENPFLNGQFLN